MIQRFFRIAALITGGVLATRQLLLAPRQSVTERKGTEEHRPRSEKTSLKQWVLRGVALFALLGLGGFLVTVSGIIPIKASSGHWALTTWFLDFAMERSVATHSLGLSAPALDNPALVLKGAGHYETGCRACHGSPELHYPRIALRMTPPPPYLPPEVVHWQANELFYIVKHGVKFTGMPAWPALHRDDEVWAMVAFLRQLPTLDAQAYRRLVQGEASSKAQAAPLPELTGPENAPRAATARLAGESCARCHGMDGFGRGVGAFPKLAGQHSSYLHAALQAYARSERHSGVMEPVAAGLSDETLREVARFYSDLPRPGPSPWQPEKAQAAEQGQTIARQGIPNQRVPACAACHGPSDTLRNPFYPRLAGQYADYLVLQLELFKQQQRGGSAYAHLMHPVATRLTSEQMHAVALYYASLTPNAAVP